MLKKLKSLFAGRATPHAEALYRATVAKARDAAFYETLGAADTVEGRYDLLTLHVHMLLTRLRGEGALAEALSQDIFDVMMKDMDASLRE
ncbi:MAG: ubiquinol-cytochrome C chaperone family protein, partial [Pseudomonadota bacterium]